MPKPTLTSLKLKKLETQKELDTILKIIEAKKPILEELLGRIRLAEKTLADDFSRQRLELQKKHRDYAAGLDAKLTTLQASIGKITDKKQAFEQELEVVEDKLAEVNKALVETTKEVAIAKQSATKSWIEVKENEDSTNLLLAQIDGLEAEKLLLKQNINKIATKHMSQMAVLSTEFNETKNVLNNQITEAEIKLRDIKKAIQLHNNKQIANEETQKKRIAELKLREDSLLIKTKALVRERAEFEIETRRWNYAKPSV